MPQSLKITQCLEARAALNVAPRAEKTEMLAQLVRENGARPDFVAVF